MFSRFSSNSHFGTMFCLCSANPCAFIAILADIVFQPGIRDQAELKTPPKL